MPLGDVIPAVTCTAQATLLTGQLRFSNTASSATAGCSANGRGALLATIESAHAGRAALRHRDEAGWRDGANRFAAPSCSGGSTRVLRSTSASRPSPITGRRQQGIRHHRLARCSCPSNWRASWARSRSSPSGGRGPGCLAPSGSRAVPPRYCKEHRPDLIAGLLAAPRL